MKILFKLLKNYKIISLRDNGYRVSTIYGHNHIYNLRE